MGLYQFLRMSTLLFGMLLTMVVSAQQPEHSQPRPLSADSSVGELLDNTAAKAVLDRHVPAFTQSAHIAMARAMSLRSLQSYAPTILTDDRLRAIDEELARTPGAVSSGKPAELAKPVTHFYSPLELQTIPLWEGGAPGAHGTERQDQPALTVIGPDGAVPNGTAVIVAPGGGYQALATGHEGRQVGDWFAAHGVTAFVLTYRLASFGYQHPTQLQDAQRAIRWVRSHADEYGVDPSRIGMIGFSAGGHLTAMVSTLADDGDKDATDPIERVSSRPDFAVVVYPAIQITRERLASMKLIVGKPGKQALRELSPAENVTARTPPTFIVHTTADEVVTPSHPIAYYNALHAVRVPVEMHIFALGRHGLGMGLSEPMGKWPDLLWGWLADCGFIATAAPRCSTGGLGTSP